MSTCGGEILSSMSQCRLLLHVPPGIMADECFLGVQILTYWTTFLILAYLTTCLVSSADYYSYEGDDNEDEPTYFIPRPNNVSYNPGETATLQCSIENLGAKYVVWRRASDPHPISIGSLIYAPDKRYNVSISKEKREYDLVIRNVQPFDSGVYECQVSSRQKIVRHILLKVNASGYKMGNWKPEIPSHDGAPSLEDNSEILLSGPDFVNSGETIRLVCNISGLGVDPDLDWFKNGNVLRSHMSSRMFIKKESSLVKRRLSSVLEIINSNTRDTGMYVCRNSEKLIKSHRVIVLNEDKNNPGKRGTAGEAKNCQIGQSQFWTLCFTTLFISVIAKGFFYLT